MSGSISYGGYFYRRQGLLGAVAAVALLLAVSSPAALQAAAKTRGRILVLMVWDGLRPDLVDARDTPQLFTLTREGALFAHHHAVFPTLTMVNAAALSTGGSPGSTGILGDALYLLPALGANARSRLPALDALLDSPINIESSRRLADLSRPGGFDGYLLGVAGVAQQIEHDGGYVAIIGKKGPTFLFDDQVEHRRLDPSHYLFIADDLARPRLSRAELKRKPLMRRGALSSIADRDQWFTQLLVERALPAARAASLHGHPALIVFWQHNPDLVQHLAGLGTQPALRALHRCDRNLATIRAAIVRLGLVHQADLMVVSDHGFATVRMTVSLTDLLVRAGIKQSRDSSDIVVAPNGGDDLVYLSHLAFASQERRRATLARIVDFAEAQEWCGPIFSRRPAMLAASVNRQNRLGWIPGTFAEQMFGLYNDARAPDLIISFRELPDLDNRKLTGPGKPAFALGLRGQIAGKNLSLRLVRPLAGVVYADGHAFLTGLGTHGAAGARELHNFGAAAGPDFRRHFVDLAPTGNADIAPTIREIFGLRQPKRASGRPLQEALLRRRRQLDAPHQQTLTAYLVLQGQEVITTLNLTEFEGHDYLDGSSVSRHILAGSP